VVANFRCEKPHRNTAFQWFRKDGVLAYLPLPDQHMSMVWSAPDALADELVGLPRSPLRAGRRSRRLPPRQARTRHPAAAFPLRLMRVGEVVSLAWP
jgi:2-polyprenyl-6-methoxyphenol hydroxylase-like FAD-dependent oxidoreductase